MSRRSRAVLAAYGVVSAANLTAITLGANTIANLTQWLLMPMLAAAFLSMTRGPSRLRVGTVAALGLSWLGDTLPDLVAADVAFVSMVGAFLCAQLAYIWAFQPDWRASILVRRPLAVLPYGLIYLVLIAACAPGAGVLLGPVIVYGLTLTAMAVLATGVHRLVGLGAAVFMASDSLIALGAFRGWESSLQSFLVMATYAVAQAVIALGVARRLTPSRR